MQLFPRLSPNRDPPPSGDAIPPRLVNLPIFRGAIRHASRHLGAFELTVDDLAPMTVSSRRALALRPGRDGVAVRFDLILDLSGAAPLLPAHRRTRTTDD